MKPSVLFSLLALLSGCHDSPTTGNLLFGRWECDSIKWAKLDMSGRLAEPWHVEKGNMVMTLSPTHMNVFVPLFPDADSLPYTQQGRTLLLEKDGTKQNAGEISTLTTTNLVLETTDTIDNSHGVWMRTFWYYHRQELN